MFIDANVFIYSILNTEEKGDRCREILKRVEAGQLKVQTSPLVIDEVSWVVRKHTNVDTAIIAWEKLIRIPNLRILAIDDRVAMRVPEIMRNYRLKPRDAIYVATMIQHQIDKIVSDDPDFDKVQEITRVELDEVMETS